MPALNSQGTSNTTITLDMTPGMMSTLRRIALDSNQPLDAVFTRAITLYQAALNAKAEGKHVGYSNSTDSLEVEFTGLTAAGSK